MAAAASNSDARRAFAAELVGRSESERAQEAQFLASSLVTPPSEQQRSAHHLGRIFAGAEWVTREVVVSRIQGIHDECYAWEARVGETYSAFSHECVWDIKTFMENDFVGVRVNDLTLTWKAPSPPPNDIRAEPSAQRPSPATSSDGL